MHRTSQSVPTVPETPVIPFPRSGPPPVATVNRVATIEPGIGCFRIVYRDEYGSPLLEWDCDYRVDDEMRECLRRYVQRIGDSLPARTAYLAPPSAPRLLR